MPTARNVAALVVLSVALANAKPASVPAYLLTVTESPAFELNKVTHKLGMGRAEFERDFGKPEKEQDTADPRLKAMHYEATLSIVAFFYDNQLYGVDFNVLEPGKPGIRCTVNLDNGPSDKSSAEDVKKTMGTPKKDTTNGVVHHMIYPDAGFSFVQGNLIGFSLTADKK